MNLIQRFTFFLLGAILALAWTLPFIIPSTTAGTHPIWTLTIMITLGFIAIVGCHIVDYWDD